MTMTEDQQNDLLIEWELYGPVEQQLMIEEYLRVYDGICNKETLFDRLEIEGYWKKVGLA